MQKNVKVSEILNYDNLNCLYVTNTETEKQKLEKWR